MSLYRGFLTVGGLTAVSRVFGFVRDVLLVAYNASCRVPLSDDTGRSLW